MIRPFFDRRHAGEILARKLRQYIDQPNTIVFALPRGGVPVGYEVARMLHAPLDICPVRKLGVPGHEELAMGAVASGGIRILIPEVIRAMHVSVAQLDSVHARELSTLEQQEKLFGKSDSSASSLQGQTIIVVDDGLATGASMLAAVTALKQQNAERVIVAVPVGAPEICQQLRLQVDELICAVTPSHLLAVGGWYEDFTVTTNDQVRTLLKCASENWRLVQDAYLAQV